MQNNNVAHSSTSAYQCCSPPHRSSVALIDTTNQPMLNYDGTELRDEKSRIVYRSQFLSTHPLKGDCKERVGFGEIFVIPLQWWRDTRFIRTLRSYTEILVRRRREKVYLCVWGWCHSVRCEFQRFGTLISRVLRAVIIPAGVMPSVSFNNFLCSEYESPTTYI